MSTNKKMLRPRVVVLIDTINGLDSAGRAALEKECDTTIENLRHIAYGKGYCSIQQAVSIANAVKGVSMTDLLPALASVKA